MPARGFLTLTKAQQPCLDLADGRQGAAGTLTGGVEQAGVGRPGRDRGEKRGADGDCKCGQPAHCLGAAYQTLPPTISPRRMRGSAQIMRRSYRRGPAKRATRAVMTKLHTRSIRVERVGGASRCCGTG